MIEKLKKKTSCSILFFLICCLPIFSFGQTKTRFPIWIFNTRNTTINGVSTGLVHKKSIKDVTTNGIRIELLGLFTLPERYYDSIPGDCDSVYQILKHKKARETINGINFCPLGSIGDLNVNGLNMSFIGSEVTKSKGLSLSYFYNSAFIHNGLQISLLINSTTTFNGVQISLMNDNYYKCSGVQIGYLINGSIGKMRGVQIAPFNIADELHGVQIGLFNKSKKTKGIQIGLININEKRIMPLVNW